MAAWEPHMHVETSHACFLPCRRAHGKHRPGQRAADNDSNELGTNKINQSGADGRGTAGQLTRMVENGRRAEIAIHTHIL